MTSWIGLITTKHFEELIWDPAEVDQPPLQKAFQDFTSKPILIETKGSHFRTGNKETASN